MTLTPSKKGQADPTSKSRNITLNEIVAAFGEHGLEEVVGLSKAGLISAKAYTIELSPQPQNLKRLNNVKSNLTVDDWMECTLSQRDHDGLFYLANSSTDRAFCEITFNRSEINRYFKMTSQSGGIQPKMGPKVYAYLAARWVCGEIKPEVDVEDLFTDMEEKNGIWDGRGPIPQRIGIPAVREFLEVVEAASQKMLQGIPVSDISFSSEPDT